ncbi:hypothetical protein LXL04_013880 [Taraxacum kok-saghyz]
MQNAFDQERGRVYHLCGRTDGHPRSAFDLCNSLRKLKLKKLSAETLKNAFTDFGLTGEWRE